MTDIVLSHYTATTCLGVGRDSLLQGLRAMRSGLAVCQFDTVDFVTCTGMVPGLEQVVLPAGLERFQCRNNQLAWLGLQADGMLEAMQQAVRQHGAERIAVVLGTSTAGILSTELAYRHRAADGALPNDFHYAETHNTFSVADFVRRALHLRGPTEVVSTACSSSAKVFASAARLLRAGLVDAVLVGGVDTLCLTTLYGFRSLGLTSQQPCRPFDVDRDGLSIGEAAAFVLLERAPDQPVPGSVLLAGYGESSDAHHMSAPHPEGAGALAAMRAALDMAGLAPDALDYINLHGTATPSNDLSEGRAVSALVGTRVPCSSTKGFVGHTLGAAGAVEAVVCALALSHGLLPGSAHTKTVDPAIAPLHYVLQTEAAPHMRTAMSNSFGFGGSNCSLVLTRSAGACQ